MFYLEDKIYCDNGGYEDSMCWAVEIMYFFSFFWAGEITVPTAATYDLAVHLAVHLAWGDVSICEDHWVVRVCLKGPM